MKKLFIAMLVVVAVVTFADEYTKKAASIMGEEFTLDRYFAATNKLYIEAEGFRADAVYKYEAAALAKQQRLLLKKQEELIVVQIELAKEQLKAARNANKVGEKRKNSHDCPEKDNRTDESNRQEKSK